MSDAVLATEFAPIATEPIWLATALAPKVTAPFCVTLEPLPTAMA